MSSTIAEVSGEIVDMNENAIFARRDRALARKLDVAPYLARYAASRGDTARGIPPRGDSVREARPHGDSVRETRPRGNSAR